MKKGWTQIELVVAMVVLLLVGGWIANIVRLAKCDFESPYKAEVVRTIGVFTGPVGSIMGFIDIEDN